MVIVPPRLNTLNTMYQYILILEFEDGRQTTSRTFKSSYMLLQYVGMTLEFFDTIKVTIRKEAVQ